MSPEQAVGEGVDSRSDLWSLGVVLREMLTGRPVFDAPNTLALFHAVQTSTLPPIRTLRPDAAIELEDIIARTMVRDRKARTITAADVHALAASCHTRLSSGTTAAVTRPAPSRRVWIAAAVIAVIGAGGVAGVVDAEERKGAVGARAGAARDHRAGRRRQIRRSVRTGPAGASVHTRGSDAGRAAAGRHTDRDY
jgi:hypothetical protein